jgi:hypothetical protein
MKSALVFALVSSLITPSLSFAGQTAAPTQPWSEVHAWKPGWEVTAVTAKSDLRHGYFIAADAAGLTMLSVSGVALRADALKTLRRAIVEHPDYFPVPDHVTFKLDERVSLGSDGLFVGGQKVAEYDEIVRRIARTDVEAGTVVLNVTKEWSNARQIMVTLGLAIAAGMTTMLIVCAAQRCD